MRERFFSEDVSGFVCCRPQEVKMHADIILAYYDASDLFHNYARPGA